MHRDATGLDVTLELTVCEASRKDDGIEYSAAYVSLYVRVSIEPTLPRFRGTGCCLYSSCTFLGYIKLTTYM